MALINSLPAGCIHCMYDRPWWEGVYVWRIYVALDLSQCNMSRIGRP